MHGAEHEEWIRAVVLGDLSAPEEVQRRRAECADCAAALDRLARVTAALDEEAREELAILALAERITDAPGTERIAAFRPPARDAHDDTQRWRARWWHALGALAAAALVIVAVWNARRGDDAPGAIDPDVLLGAPEVRLEPFDGFGNDLVLRFEARDDIAPDVAEWELLVTDDGDYDERFRTSARAWSDPEAVSRFPARVSVTVSALNASGREIGRSAAVHGSRAR